MVRGMTDDTIERRLERLEAMNLSLRDQLSRVALDVARLERTMLSRGAEIATAVLELRELCVELATEHAPLRMQDVPRSLDTVRE